VPPLEILKTDFVGATTPPGLLVDGSEICRLLAGADVPIPIALAVEVMVFVPLVVHWACANDERPINNDSKKMFFFMMFVIKSLFTKSGKSFNRQKIERSVTD
jgi:hypothetical protein